MLSSTIMKTIFPSKLKLLLEELHKESKASVSIHVSGLGSVCSHSNTKLLRE